MLVSHEMGSTSDVAVSNAVVGALTRTWTPVLSTSRSMQADQFGTLALERPGLVNCLREELLELIATLLGVDCFQGHKSGGNISSVARVQLSPKVVRHLADLVCCDSLPSWIRFKSARCLEALCAAPDWRDILRTPVEFNSTRETALSAMKSPFEQIARAARVSRSPDSARNSGVLIGCLRVLLSSLTTRFAREGSLTVTMRSSTLMSTWGWLEGMFADRRGEVRYLSLEIWHRVLDGTVIEEEGDELVSMETRDRKPLFLDDVERFLSDPLESTAVRGTCLSLLSSIVSRTMDGSTVSSGSEELPDDIRAKFEKIASYSAVNLTEKGLAGHHGVHAALKSIGLLLDFVVQQMDGTSDRPSWSAILLSVLKSLKIAPTLIELLSSRGHAVRWMNRCAAVGLVSEGGGMGEETEQPLNSSSARHAVEGGQGWELLMHRHSALDARRVLQTQVRACDVLLTIFRLSEGHDIDDVSRPGAMVADAVAHTNLIESIEEMLSSTVSGFDVRSLGIRNDETVEPLYDMTVRSALDMWIYIFRTFSVVNNDRKDMWPRIDLAGIWIKLSNRLRIEAERAASASPPDAANVIDSASEILLTKCNGLVSCLRLMATILGHPVLGPTVIESLDKVGHYNNDRAMVTLFDSLQSLLGHSVSAKGAVSPRMVALLYALFMHRIEFSSAESGVAAVKPMIPGMVQLALGTVAANKDEAIEALSALVVSRRSAICGDSLSASRGSAGKSAVTHITDSFVGRGGPVQVHARRPLGKSDHVVGVVDTHDGPRLSAVSKLTKQFVQKRSSSKW